MYTFVAVYVHFNRFIDHTVNSQTVVSLASLWLRLTARPR